MVTPGCELLLVDTDYEIQDFGQFCLKMKPARDPKQSSVFQDSLSKLQSGSKQAEAKEEASKGASKRKQAGGSKQEEASKRKQVRGSK